MAHSSATQDPIPASSLDIHEVPEALQVPTKSVRFGFQLLLCLANTVFWLGLLPVGQILLPTQVAAIDAVNKVSNLAIVTAIGALTALITNPIAGALSDRTTSRLGRRRAWFIFGTALSAITLALMATASTIAALVLWWAFFHIAVNAVLAALAAVIPDRVPVHQRATVSAFVSLSLPLGAVMGVILVTR